MPKDDLYITGRYVEVLEQRADCVTQVMDLDDADLVVVADAAEGPD